MTLIALAIAIACWLLSCDPWPTDTITDLARYEYVRSNIEPASMVAHFPAAIPASATAARLAYFPGWLQGGLYFQLWLELPRAEADEVYKQFGVQAQYRLQAGDTESLGIAIPAHLYATDSKSSALPLDFECFILLAQDDGSPGFPWNHGTTYGVAVDPAASHVVYWLESW